ncbi:MAG: VCBS repeat-containing protein [Candidatus Binatia bacterium]
MKPVAAAPLNADGRVDIVAVDVVGNVHIFLQNAAGMFEDQGSPVSGSLQVAGAAAMQIVGVNNDTTPDLLFAVAPTTPPAASRSIASQQPSGTVTTRSPSRCRRLRPVGARRRQRNGGGPLDRGQRPCRRPDPPLPRQQRHLDEPRPALKTRPA